MHVIFGGVVLNDPGVEGGGGKWLTFDDKRPH